MSTMTELQCRQASPRYRATGGRPPMNIKRSAKRFARKYGAPTAVMLVCLIVLLLALMRSFHIGVPTIVASGKAAIDGNTVIYDSSGPTIYFRSGSDWMLIHSVCQQYLFNAS